MRALPATTVVLDGEAIALDDAGRPRPFQETASRTAMGSGVEVTPYFFDLLHLDGADLLDEPGHVRADGAGAAGPRGSYRVPRLVTVRPRRCAGLRRRRRSPRGHEGVVVKNLAAPYDAGRRGSAWVKVKPVHTLDLVVLAVEWGSGRREGWLSNIHLGARDPATGGFVMLGKTFKGMTDEMLAWQTERFTELAVSRRHDPRQLRRRGPPRAGRRDRLRRRPALDPLPRRDGAPVRPGRPLPRRQDRRPRPTRSTPCGSCSAASDARP